MPEPQARRLLRAGAVEFDEARLEVRVNGAPVHLETKPMALLHALLQGGGAVISRQALIQAAWGNADHTSAASLATAISKLRSALGVDGRDVVGVVHGGGYRIAAPVEVAVLPSDAASLPEIVEGEPLPDRAGWRLQALPWAPGSGRIWGTLCTDSGEVRVCKFAVSAEALAALRREAEIARSLEAVLGRRVDFVSVLGTRFDRSPYFIERERLGPDLVAWLRQGGDLGAASELERVACIAALARTVASAHAAGVLHGALEPAHVLLQPGPDLRLAPINYLGQGGDPPRAPGPAAYAAPERSPETERTIGMDVYALGVLLYQFAVGDLSRPLGVGWEADIADPLLREDIACAACADPASRLPSSGALAERLEQLAERRRQAAHARRVETETASWRRLAERNRLRRPWVIATAGSLAAGLLVTSALALHATAERNTARRQAELARAVTAFLSVDLLGRGNPVQSSRADETLMQAARAAEAEIDGRLAAAPLVAGSLHLTFATAFESRNGSDAARGAYRAAIAAFDRAGREGRADRVMAMLRLAALEAQSGQPGSPQRARALIAAGGEGLDALGSRRAEATVWFDAARGEAEMLGGDVQLAGAAFAHAADLAETMPISFDAFTRIRLRRLEAKTYLRRGEWKRAGLLFAALRDRSVALVGVRHPDTLELQLSLAETWAASGRTADAVALLDRIEPDFVAVFGPSHQATLDLLATRSGALAWLSRYPRAIADQQALVDRVEARDGRSGFYPLAARIDLADMQCRAGSTAVGAALARTTLSAIERTQGADSTIAKAAAGKLAFCMVLNGEGAAALPLLDRIDLKSVAQMTSDPEYAAELGLIRTAIACGSKTPAPWPDTAAFARDDADPFYRDWSKRLAGACRSSGA